MFANLWWGTTQFGSTMLGMPYVMFDVPSGTVKGIAAFYRNVMETQAKVKPFEKAPAAHILVGQGQTLIFREKKGKLPKYDGHHLALYVANFSRPHAKIAEQGLISQESNQHQYRFKDIVDDDNGDVLFTLEHEIRSMTHPLYARPLVNRNPDQTNMAYSPGYEERAWAMPYSA